MEPRTFLPLLRADAERLAAAARSDLGVPVLACPGWDVGDLVRHTCDVHAWATKIVAEQLQARPAFEPTTVGRDELVATYVAAADTLLKTLEAADPATPVWGFGDPPNLVAFWCRRQAHEISIHRWDGERAVGAPTPIDAGFAVDGIEEFFTLLRTRILPRRPDASIGATLHLHATDADGEWMISLEGGRLEVEHGHGKGGAAVRGTASDLALGMWRRKSFADDPSFEVFGDRSAVGAFQDLCAF